MVGASGVGPRQVFDSMDQCLKKEAVFSLRMAVLGPKRSFWKKGMMRCQETSGIGYHSQIIN
jgi:hypothetical protein